MATLSSPRVKKDVLIGRSVLEWLSWYARHRLADDEGDIRREGLGVVGHKVLAVGASMR
jgi:hypothetical protein